MSDQMVLEIVGYVASALVAVSLTMSSILRLRLINLLGSVMSDPGSPAHAAYLERIGFVDDVAGGAGRLYRLRLA